jgi:hypothetical protein
MSWIALGKRSVLANMKLVNLRWSCSQKILPSFHQRPPKTWSSPNLRWLQRSHQLMKTIGQLPSPPTFVPRATDELWGVVSTSGHCHLEGSIDTIFAPCLQVEQSMMLKLLASYVLFPS